MKPRIFRELIDVAEYYGYDTQKKKAIEELAELIKALATGSVEEITEEMADVEIMLTQLRILKINPIKAEKYKEEKIKRQLKRIEKEREETKNE